MDIIRLDHFRGFEAFWEIPGKAKTAESGRWVKGPGAQFFSVLEKYFGGLPIIVEDLGVITPQVDDLKHQFYFPGIKVLHFAIDYSENQQTATLCCEKNSVLYTGTHDNDTTQGWYKKLLAQDPKRAKCIEKLLTNHLGASSKGKSYSRRLVEFTYGSNANTLIVPMQDILCLGSEARMNLPGTVGSNWDWRCPQELVTKALQHKLAELVSKYNR